MSKKYWIQNIDDERIVFSAVLDRGVPTVPKGMVDVVNEICAKYNKTLNLSKSGGNFEQCWFIINEGFSEEEAEQIEKEFWNR